MIAVICAHNPGRRNLGMYSVDLAAQEFFSGSGHPFELVKFVGHERIGRLRYRILPALEELQRYTAAVFWGDFQQNPLWGRKNFAPRFAREQRLSLEQAYSQWRRLCLFDWAPSADHRIFSIGTCFLGAENEWQTGPARHEYSRLLSRFCSIMPRDPGSFAELQARGLMNVIQGFDCASLLTHPSDDVPQAKCFAYAFGRTLTPVQGEMLALKIEQATGCRGIPLRWLLGKHSFKLCDFRYRRALATIRQVRFVVTDIYHLSLNTMALNRQVICVGRGTAAFQDSCDDYKKELLFRMTDLEQSYLKLPQDSDPAGDSIASTIAGLVSGGSGDLQGFRRVRDKFRVNLQRVLFPIGPSLRNREGCPDASPPGFRQAA